MDGIEKEFVIRTLRSLLNDYGLELYKQEYSQKFYGIVSDSFGSEYSKYRKLLKLAIQEKIPARMLSKDKRPDEEKLMFLSELNKSFAGEYDIKLNTAKEIVEILAEGLNWNLNNKKVIEKSCEFENKVKQSISLELKENIKMKMKYNFVKAFTIVLVLFIFSLAVKNSGASDYPSQPKEVQEVNTSTETTIVEEKPLTQQEIRAAINAYNAGNYKASIPTLKKAAEQNHAEAAFYYAQMLRRGEYVSRNLPEAIKYFKKAQEYGYNSANNTLGVIYRDNFSGEKYEKLAFEYFTRGTEFSPPDLYAKINMAKCLSSGFGTKRDPQKAIDLFKEAISDDCAMNYNGLAKSCVNELREDAFIGIINTIEKYYEYDSLYTLTQLLTYEIEQEENRAYILFRYITTYIAYDTSYSIYDGMQAFQYKKGVCAAYADLFETMCKYVGINAKYTSGYGVIDGNYKRHAWNVVYLKTADKKIFCDPCWAAGGVTTDQKFIFNYDSKWWTTDESFFGQQHIPD